MLANKRREYREFVNVVNAVSAVNVVKLEDVNVVKTEGLLRHLFCFSGIHDIHGIHGLYGLSVSSLPDSYAVTIVTPSRSLL